MLTKWRIFGAFLGGSAYWIVFGPFDAIRLIYLILYSLALSLLLYEIRISQAKATKMAT